MVFNIEGGLKQLRAKRADRALARGGVHRVQGAGSLEGVVQGATPLCLRKFLYFACLKCIISDPF